MGQKATIKARTSYEDIDSFVAGYGPYFESDGLFIRTRSPKEVGTQLRFELQLKTGEPAFRGEGTVTEARSQITNVPGMRVLVSKLDRRSKQLMDQILATRQIRTTKSTPAVKAPPPETPEEPRAGHDHAQARVITRVAPVPPPKEAGTPENQDQQETRVSPPPPVPPPAENDRAQAGAPDGLPQEAPETLEVRQTDSSFGLTSQDLEEIADRVEHSLDSVFSGDSSQPSAGPFSDMFSEEQVLDGLGGPSAPPEEAPSPQASPTAEAPGKVAEALSGGSEQQDEGDRSAYDVGTAEVYVPEPVSGDPDASGGLGELVATAAEADVPPPPAIRQQQQLARDLESLNFDESDPPEHHPEEVEGAAVDAEAPAEKASIEQFDDLDKVDKVEIDISTFADDSKVMAQLAQQHLEMPDVDGFSDAPMELPDLDELQNGPAELPDLEALSSLSDRDFDTQTPGETFDPSVGASPAEADPQQAAELAAFEADMEEHPDEYPENPSDIPLHPDGEIAGFEDEMTSQSFYEPHDEWLGGAPDANDSGTVSFSAPINEDEIQQLSVELPSDLTPMSGHADGGSAGLVSDTGLGNLNLALASHYDDSEELPPLAGVEDIGVGDPLPAPVETFERGPDSEVLDLRDSLIIKEIQTGEEPALKVSHGIMAESLPPLQTEAEGNSVDSLMSDLLSTDIPSSGAISDKLPLEQPADAGFPLPIDEEERAPSAPGRADLFDQLAAEPDPKGFDRDTPESKSGLLKKLFGRKKR